MVDAAPVAGLAGAPTGSGPAVRPLPCVDGPGAALRAQARGLLRFARRKPLGAAGGAVLLVLVLAALAAPLAAPYDREQIGLGPSFAGPSWQHPMGLDQLGRDLLTRVIWGGRLSLGVGLATTLLATVAGTLLGLTTAYLGGTFDLVVQRLVDAMIVFPALILALLLMAVLGQSTLNVVVAMTFVFVPRLSRVIRSSVLTLRGQLYVEAARAAGAQDWRIMARHLLPNAMAPILVLATVVLGNAFVNEASLSFLGIGSSPEQPSWGRLLSGAATANFREAPHLAVFPGLVLCAAVLAVNFLGDALRDVWDPRLNGST